MRFLTIALATLLLLVHAELWFGSNGALRVAGLKRQLAQQLDRNAQASARNEQLVAEVRDLREGLEMVEEKARFELGMVKPNEIYVHVARRP
jgi:cell division protein FtsB